MSSINLNIPHNLSQEEALSRIKGMLTKVKEEHSDKINDVKEEWDNSSGQFQFNIQGFDLSGLIKVNPSNVEITGKLPFALSFFKGRIAQLISDKAREILA